MKVSITVMTNDGTWEGNLITTPSALQKGSPVKIQNSLVKQVPQFLFYNPAIEVSFEKSGTRIYGTSIISPALGIVKCLISDRFAKWIFCKIINRMVRVMYFEEKGF